ncbi:MAG: L,D-transpeptidase [Myxococcales bacterium]|nr:L,D-transpeptidase [Myxococcales bacterium]
MRRWALSTVLMAAACTGAHEPRSPKAAADRAPATRASTADATPASAPAPRSERSRELDLSQYFGDGYPPSALREPGTGIGSLGYGTWVQPAPRSGSLPLGSIRVGGSIPLVDSTPVPGNGKCPRFVKVERGFVCAGPRATLDMQSAWMSAGRWTEPAPGTMPYQYALSVGVPMLMSPGKTNPTPHGRYFIESKHHYSSMGSGRGAFWIADVPWTIYFERPFAIHTSYWHEDFGQRKSGGCINLSPLDAKRVFDWAAPELPPGWDTVQADGMGGGTFVLIES